MKHFILLFTLLCCATGSQAQETALYECLYQYEVNGTDKNGQPFSDIYNGILQISASQAKFMDYTDFQSDSVTQARPDDAELQKEYDIQVLKNPCYFDQTVYQNLPQGKMTVLSVRSARSNVPTMLNSVRTTRGLTARMASSVRARTITTVPLTAT